MIQKQPFVTSTTRKLPDVGFVLGSALHMCFKGVVNVLFVPQVRNCLDFLVFCFFDNKFASARTHVGSICIRDSGF